MAVDIKSLRIDSHILINGKRERVRGLDEDNGLIVRFPAEYVSANEVEPIPITSDRLKELGFKWRKNLSCWRKYQNYDGKNYDWGIYAYEGDGGTWCFSLYLPNFLIKPQLYAEYLHELEGQLAYYSVELITV